MSAAPRTPTVAIVGAGMSGLCMGMGLKKAGIDSFTIYEKADRVGGTWRENTYPGLQCDVPSLLYQYSFETNPDWSKTFSPGGEIWRYLDRVADRHDLRSHIEFGKEVVDARFEAGAGTTGRWRIRTSDGAESTADFLVSACGVLHHPRVPDIEGLDSFEGTAFHSARWDHSVDLRGKRVGVVGTGSTGVQIVGAVAEAAGRLTLFQRTAQWVLPMPNLPSSPVSRALQRRFPVLSRLGRRWTQALFELFAVALVRPGWQRSFVSWACRRNLRRVKDPELRRGLTPDYQPMCKRLVLSNGFYKAMQRDNVALVTDAIDHVEPRGVVTVDGTLHELDVLVLATGFDAHAYMRPLELTGPDGLTLSEAWSDGRRAYRTVAVPGFPNFFMLLGPHSPVGNVSLITVAETQARYVMRWIDLWRKGKVATMAPTAEATARFNEELRGALPSTVWVTGCRSWYLDEHGDPELWPWSQARHRDALREPVLADFDVTTVAERDEPARAA